MKRKKTRTPEQKAKRKKVFQTFSRLVLGAVKIWLAGSPYIVLLNDVDDFIAEFPNVEVDKKIIL